MNPATSSKIEQIKDCIERANNLQSNLSPDALYVPALSSLRIRHLMNNLGGISSRYLEHGVHKGGLFCSTIYDNYSLLSATAVDSFESDQNSEDKAEPQFLENVRICCPKSLMENIKLIKQDSFSVDPKDIPGPIDLYLFDADHSQESQRKAVTHFLSVMSDEFILCVDDYKWQEVTNGTQNGIIESECEVLYEMELVTEGDHNNDSWWNGFYVALLKKQS